MYPAIIEAHQSRVPLIVITADRPHELRHSGANQTIDQIKMFGDFVLWFVDMALPEANPPAIAIRNLRTTANRAYAKANGLRKGVVHINMPFRKPLEPTEVEGDMVDVPDDVAISKDNRSNPSFYKPIVVDDIHHELLNIFHKNVGIIISGRENRNLKATTGFAHSWDFPIFADALSGCRFGLTTDTLRTGAYETYLGTLGKLPYQPNLVIRLGHLPLSKSLNQFLDKLNPEYYIAVSEHDEWIDDVHKVTHVVQSRLDMFASSMLLRGGVRKYTHTDAISELEKSTWQTIDHEIAIGQYFDGAVVYDVVELIPDESTLFAGNSLLVRHLDQFGKPSNKRIYAYANRGASGIDGNISTALGTGAARPDKPLVAILGDITFYHDMNGLLAVHRCGVPITIVLINNDGGGIFNRLPIRDFEPEFTDYFLTPHGLDFSHTAKLYGLDYLQIDAYSEGAREQFRDAFSEKVGSGKSTIIEVRTDLRKDEARRQEIVAAVHEKLRELDL